MHLTGSNWFVRNDNLINGPFDPSVLLSMKDRGRVSINTCLSLDRKQWIPVSKFDEFNFDVPTDIEDVVDPRGATQFFYLNSGQQQGPVSTARLQELVDESLLSKTSLIWFEGAGNWIPAEALNDLSFPSESEKAKSWLSTNMAIVSLALIGVVFFFAAPAWYVLRADSLLTQANLVAKLDAEKATAKADRDKANVEKRRQEVEEQKANSETLIKLAEILAKNNDANQPKGRFRRGDFIGSGSFFTVGSWWTGQVMDYDGFKYEVKITGAGTTSKYKEGDTCDFTELELVNND